MREKKDNIKYISKVEIQELWGRYDLEWNLNPDVNILSGINGSGKSTILESVNNLVSERKASSYDLNSLLVTFNNGDPIRWLKINNLSEIKHEKSLIKALEKDKLFKKVGESEPFNIILHFPEVTRYTQKLNIDIINTFDTKIDTKTQNNYEKLDVNVQTELDKDIYILEKKYLNYQLNIGRKAFEIISKNNSQNARQEVLKITEKQERFLTIIDSLFRATNKKINRDKNEISFLFGNRELSPYQLSSGEKQVLMILLTVLVQDTKPSIIFMDEPEISLHIDWQKKLIGYLRELNPNAQIILATHSPALIMEGWTDKVFDVRDLITKDYFKN